MWAFCSTVNLHSPKVFQIFKFLSLPPLAIYLLSGENATERTSLVWLTNLLVVTPFLRSQSLRVPSHEELKQYLLSYERVMSLTKWEWPKSQGWKNWELITLHNLSWNAPFLILICIASFNDIPGHDSSVSWSSDKELSSFSISKILLSNLHACDPATVT